MGKRARQAAYDVGIVLGVAALWFAAAAINDYNPADLLIAIPCVFFAVLSMASASGLSQRDRAFLPRSGIKPFAPLG